MKTKHYIGILLAALIFSTGCREITVTTSVHEDGSFTRFIRIISDDSSSVYDLDLPYPVDASWNKKYAYDSANTEKPYTLTYSKKFSHDKALNDAIHSDTGWRRNLDREVKITKRSGLFYSYLQFSENIKAANPFTYLNYNDYLSPEDINLLNGTKAIQTKEDSTKFKVAEENAERFLLESITYEIIGELEKGLEMLNDPSLNPADVVKFKDSIAAKVENLDVSDNSSFIDYYAEWTGNTDVLKLKEMDASLFNDSNKNLTLFLNILSMESYQQVVQLPGLLIETNSLSPLGNRAGWKVDPMSFMFADFTMLAESRIINYWTFILTGVILLGLVILLLIKAFKR